MAAGSGDSATTRPVGVVPRWEWRTFGAGFGAASDLLAGLTPQRAGSSEELYFVSVHSDASVKVRDGLMDVKRLLRVDDDGLELWTPVLQANFPLSHDDVSAVLTSLGVAGSAPRLASYTLDDFVGRDHPTSSRHAHRGGAQATHPLPGRRMQRRVDRDHCRSHDDGHLGRRVAGPVPGVGHSQPARPAGRRNVSVSRGLKTLVGFGTRRLAVIDVGTNSVKFHIVERHGDGSLQAVVDRADITRLGEGQADSGVLAEEAIARTVEVIAAMVDEAHRSGASDIVCVGTAGLRRAPNRTVLVDAVSARAGLTVEVISGEEEGRLAYLAATSALPAVQGRLAVFDSGGGSTQFTFGRRAHIDERFSLDVGAVRVAERFGLASAVDTKTLDAALAALSSDLDRLDGRPRPDAIVAIGGTATNLAAVKHQLVNYDPDRVHGTVLDIAELDRQIELYRTRSADERRQIAGLQAARADVILAGACIVRTIFTKLQTDSMTVSDRGLRHGVVIARFAD